MSSTIRLMVLVSCVMIAGRCGAVDRYVNAANPSPVAPFLFASSAAVRIQDAVEVSSPGDVIWVTNGTYNTGGTLSSDGLTNRVYIDKAVTVKSVNGPAVTVIEGANGVGGLYNTGPGAVRCVYMTNGATLSGFTITNGHSLNNSTMAGQGGGICSAVSGIISNCVIVGNSAYQNAGGIFGGWAFNCLIDANNAWNGGGAFQSELRGCEIRNNTGGSDGGGVSVSVAEQCVIRNNSGDLGGGAYGSVLLNCLVYGNSARAGGGVYFGSVENCTVCSNSASVNGGGLCDVATATNSIVYFNSAPVSNNWARTVDFFSCCTTPMPLTGANNITVAPTFVDSAAGNYHLRSGSSCVNAGTNRAWMTSGVDLDGNPRINRDVVDIGAYESKSTGLPFLPIILSDPN